MQAPVLIIADDRETGSGVIEVLETTDGVRIRVGRLASGTGFSLSARP